MLVTLTLIFGTLGNLTRSNSFALCSALYFPDLYIRHIQFVLFLHFSWNLEGNDILPTVHLADIFMYKKDWEGKFQMIFFNFILNHPVEMTYHL